MGYMCLFQFWFPQGICLGVGLPSHMVILFLLFKEFPYHLPQWLYQFTFPPTVQEHFLFSTPSPAFIVCRLFDDDHSDWCEMISHCGFDLHFSNNEQCWEGMFFLKDTRLLLPRGGNGNTLQHLCLESPTDRGAWWATKSVGSQRVEHNWVSIQAVINKRLLYKGMYIFLFSSYIFSFVSPPLSSSFAFPQWKRQIL